MYKKERNMLTIKKFSKKLIILTDGENDYEIVAQDVDFDRDLLEDILDYSERTKEEKL